MVDVKSADLATPISAEVPSGWGKHLSGRLVTFGEGENIAWGVELDIPVDDSVRAALSQSDFSLPIHVKHIKYVTLAPQEALPKEQRNIQSKVDNMSKLQALSETTKNLLPLSNDNDRPLLYLPRYFQTVLPDRGSKEIFQTVVNNSKGSEIVIVHGHGGAYPKMIGEKFVNDRPIDKNNKPLQRRGNSVSVDEIQMKYNDPQRHVAILLDACSPNDVELQANKIPLFYIQGKSGLNSANEALNTPRYALPIV